MPKKDKAARKKERDRKKAARGRAKRLEKRRVVCLDITNAAEEEIVSLVPVDIIEGVIGRPVELSLFRSQSEMLDWSLENYNHVVTNDIHERCKNVDPSEHPLHKYFNSHVGRRDFASVVGYRHNQIVLVGTCDEEVVVNLQLASVYPRSLYLGYLELANPNKPAERPLDHKQRYAGIGNGVSKLIVNNVREFAGANGFSRVTAYAKDLTRASIFCRRGFSLDKNNSTFQLAIQNDSQIPLIIDLASSPPT